jgi:cell division protein FtsL
VTKPKTTKSTKAKAAKPIKSIRPVWGACLVVLAGLILFGGLSVVESAAETRALYQALGEVQRQHDQLLEAHSRLSLERSTMSSLQKIETVALEDLHMVFPAEIEQVTDG